MKYTLLLSGLIALLTSCNSGKNIQNLVYLNNMADSAAVGVVQHYEARIQPGDRLSITVSALNPASAAPYNLSVGGSTTGGTTASAVMGGYIVENDGTIAFPQLGKIKAAGLTRTELTNQLSATLTKFLMDPVVLIQFLNFKVTVLGEVNSPGPVSLPEGKLTIIEAIGQARDLTLYGKRENILVIREREGRRELGRVDLTSTKVFASPYYQLQQNDVVYVEMTKEKVAAADQTTYRNIGVITSIASVATSFIVLIISLLK